MATYLELYDLRSNTLLRNKVRVAVEIKAQAIIASASPTNTELMWARDTLANPIPEADKIFGYLLAANSNAAVNQIEGASDSNIQAHVDTAVDKLNTIT